MAGHAGDPDHGTGASDSIYTMNAGIPSYGISGVAIDRDDVRMHGKDERIGVESFFTGVEFYHEFLKILTTARVALKGLSPEYASGPMGILQLFESRQRDLGGFTVRRVLPAADRQMVGPFIFFDHLGPTAFAPGSGIDVRPHPHIALATVTYLFAGSLEHRDSLGTVREIRPGDVNWMSAGEGIVHSERTPRAARAAGEDVHGIQSWVALPDGREDGPPTFVHYPASSLPRRVGDGVDLTLVAGEAFGLTSPVATLWPTLYVDASFSPGALLELPAQPHERALYMVPANSPSVTI